MSEFKLTTPVAFIIFNRPDSTEKVFSEIAKVKPSKLLVVADGARLNKVGEVEKVKITRSILKRIDWDCDVVTNFSEINLGCKVRVSSGLDWVFEQVEEAIILEDDCIPHVTFFRFCQEMLSRFKCDQRIGMISGDNFYPEKYRNNDSYTFSKYTHIWGWATWRDRWVGNYDVNLNKWPVIKNEGWLEDIIGNKDEAIYWGRIFESVFSGQVDTWDYQWFFANLIAGKRSIVPTVNLISNIGFATPDATHTTVITEQANMPIFPMGFPLAHPEVIVANKISDEFCYHNYIKKSIYKKFLKKIRNLLRIIFKWSR